MERLGLMVVVGFCDYCWGRVGCEVVVGFVTTVGAGLVVVGFVTTVGAVQMGLVVVCDYCWGCANGVGGGL